MRGRKKNHKIIFTRKSLEKISKYSASWKITVFQKKTSGSGPRPAARRVAGSARANPPSQRCREKAAWPHVLTSSHTRRCCPDRPVWDIHPSHSSVSLSAHNQHVALVTTNASWGQKQSFYTHGAEGSDFWGPFPREESVKALQKLIPGDRTTPCRPSAGPSQAIRGMRPGNPWPQTTHQPPRWPHQGAGWPGGPEGSLCRSGHREALTLQPPLASQLPFLLLGQNSLRLSTWGQSTRIHFFVCHIHLAILTATFETSYIIFKHFHHFTEIKGNLKFIS